MKDADAKQYAENRLKEMRKAQPDRPMTDIVTNIIVELYTHYNYVIHFFGKPLEGVGIDSNGICTYAIRGK